MADEKEYLDADGNEIRRGFYEIIGRNKIIYSIGDFGGGSWGWKFPNGEHPVFKTNELRPVDPDERIGKLEAELAWIKSQKPIRVPDSSEIVGL